MSGGYSYNPAMGLDTSSDLQALTRDLDQSLSNLEQSVARFQSANSGMAVDGYQVAQGHWSQAQQEMHASLGDAINALNEIHNEILRGDILGAGQFGA